MRKRNLKTYEQYLIDYQLSKGFDSTDISTNDINNVFKNKYEKMFLDYLLMLDVVDNISNENINDIIIDIQNHYFENNANKFFESFNKSKRISYLTPYSIKDLKRFNLFKLRGYNIGFAIKNNGDIILVHNNENVKGIGNILIQKAIQNGGTHLDHFDGFLTGFYKQNGFKFKNNDIFNDDFAPENWNYEKIDILNPDKSIYVNEYKVAKTQFIDAKIRYENGKPDIVYRKLNPK